MTNREACTHRSFAVQIQQKDSRIGVLGPSIRCVATTQSLFKCQNLVWRGEDSLILIFHTSNSFEKKVVKFLRGIRS